jgi:hypothetical protein
MTLQRRWSMRQLDDQLMRPMRTAFDYLLLAICVAVVGGIAFVCFSIEVRWGHIGFVLALIGIAWLFDRTREQHRRESADALMRAWLDKAERFDMDAPRGSF